MAGVVEGLGRTCPGEGTVADHCQGLPLIPRLFPRFCKADSYGDGVAGVSRIKGVVHALLPRRGTRSDRRPVSVWEHLPATRNDLVGSTGGPRPYDCVPRGVKNVMEGEGQFDNPRFEER